MSIFFSKFKLTNIYFSLEKDGFEQGKPSFFIKFKGCSFNCIQCYNKMTSYKEVDMNYIIENLEKLRTENYCVKRIVLTGGNPIQQEDILYLIKELKDIGFYVVLKHVGIFTEDTDREVDILTKCDKVMFYLKPPFYYNYDKVLNDKNLKYMFYTISKMDSINFLKKTNKECEIIYVFKTKEDLNFLLNTVNVYGTAFFDYGVKRITSLSLKPFVKGKKAYVSEGFIKNEVIPFLSSSSFSFLFKQTKLCLDVYNF